MFEVATGQIVEFGEYRLDNVRRLLIKNGEVVPLTHKAFETLALLVAANGRIVGKEELLREIWPDTFVEEGSLSRNISVVRKALGEGPSDHQYIQTIPKQGYRFVAPVREVFEPIDDSRPNVETPVQGSRNALIGEKKPEIPGRKSPMIYAVGAGIILAAGVMVLALYFALAPADSKTRPRTFSVTRFTSTGKAIDAAISPDGKYVVYAISDLGKQSLWVKQVASGSEVQIVAPAEVNFQGLSFSADGNFVFFNVWDKVHVGEIFKIPVLGGIPAKIVNDVMPMISVSPDSSEILFVRSLAASSESMLMAGKTDGTGERTISRIGGPRPGWFGGPVWSPDGSRIAFALGSVGEQGQSYVRLADVPSEGGEPRIISDKRFINIGALAWHANGHDLVVTASQQFQTPNQLWRVDTRSGQAERLTNDLSGYNGLSITADGKSLVTTQGDFQSNIYLGGDGAASEWKKLTSGRYEGLGLAWTPDDRLLFVSQESGNDDIWIMNADGTGRKQLTVDPSVDASPSVSFDGKYVFFASLRTGVPHIFRMGIDGSDLVQLTRGQGEWSPIASPTEPNLIYQSTDGRGIWKMNVDGGESVRLNEEYSYSPAFSHDGTQIIFSYWDEKGRPEQLRQARLNLLTGVRTNVPSVPKTAIRSDSNVVLKWSPGDNSFAYIDDNGGISNIWRQPLAGGRPVRVTGFNDSYIYSFDWSKDGRIAAARGSFAFDVVLISGLDL